MIFRRSKTSSKSPAKASARSPAKKGRGSEKYKSAEFVEDESSDEEDAGSPPEKKGEDQLKSKMKLVVVMFFPSRSKVALIRINLSILPAWNVLHMKVSLILYVVSSVASFWALVWE